VTIHVTWESILVGFGVLALLWYLVRFLLGFALMCLLWLMQKF